MYDTHHTQTIGTPLPTHCFRFLGGETGPRPSVPARGGPGRARARRGARTPSDEVDLFGREHHAVVLRQALERAADVPRRGGGTLTRLPDLLPFILRRRASPLLSLFFNLPPQPLILIYPHRSKFPPEHHPQPLFL